MTKDPVCKREIEVSEFKTSHGGAEYCFCSTKCKEIFDKSPADYAVADAGEMPA